MDDFKVRKVPAFGEWNSENGLLHHSFKERDLYGKSYIYGEDIRIPVVSPYTKKRIEGHDLQHGRKYEIPKVVTAYKVPKPIDEDLYRIPHEKYHSNAKRKKNSGFFSRCFEPTCDE
ncbi:hypothetical protein ACHQM5_028082 [Ranunculus cassubicifolius]